MSNSDDLVFQKNEADPIGGLPFMMPRRSSARPGDIMMLDEYKRWHPADVFGDRWMQPYGYQRFPGGFMMQWGTTQSINGYGYSSSSSFGNNYSDQTFYKAYNNVCFGVYGNGTGSFSYNSNYGNTGNMYNTTYPSAGFTFTNLSRWGFRVFNNTPIDMTCQWFAVGY